MTINRQNGRFDVSFAVINLRGVSINKTILYVLSPCKRTKNKQHIVGKMGFDREVFHLVAETDKLTDQLNTLICIFLI
jgi:hypothetical protein